MKVSELIELLSNEHIKDYEVLVSSDSEGNNFNFIEAISGLDQVYKLDGGIEVGLGKLNPHAAEQGFTEEDVLSDGEPCIVLWP